VTFRHRAEARNPRDAKNRSSSITIPSGGAESAIRGRFLFRGAKFNGPVDVKLVRVPELAKCLLSELQDRFCAGGGEATGLSKIGSSATTPAEFFDRLSEQRCNVHG